MLSDPKPEPEVVAKVTRRRFSAAQKARILEEYESASAVGKAQLCRRERIYSSHIANWRKQLAAGAPLEAKRGRKPDPQAIELMRLSKENARLEQQLAKAQRVLGTSWTCRRGTNRNRAVQ
jgi:transposase